MSDERVVRNVLASCGLVPPRDLFPESRVAAAASAASISPLASIGRAGTGSRSATTTPARVPSVGGGATPSTLARTDESTRATGGQNADVSTPRTDHPATPVAGAADPGAGNTPLPRSVTTVGGTSSGAGLVVGDDIVTAPAASASAPTDGAVTATTGDLLEPAVGSPPSQQALSQHGTPLQVDGSALGSQTERSSAGNDLQALSQHRTPLQVEGSALRSQTEWSSAGNDLPRQELQGVSSGSYDETEGEDNLDDVDASEQLPPEASPKASGDGGGGSAWEDILSALRTMEVWQRCAVNIFTVGYWKGVNSASISISPAW